ncbi:MAG: VRR-NUC domain-containing protein [Ginsengibacter sp.]
MKLESIKQKAPGFFELSGGFEMKTRPYKDNSANELTKSIIDFIIFSGGDANRINTQGQMRKIDDRMVWTNGSTRKGTADIHAIYQGRAISIEVKIGRDKLSENQKKEAERIQRAGGLYFVATDMISFLEWWQNQFRETAVGKV